MLTGHASHQIGLDADIWFTPMPNRRLSHTEREEMSAISMLAPGQLEVDPTLWDPARARIIKRAASSPEVERVLVHPAIKKALCEAAPGLGADRNWLNKVRPYWGHHYHFHVRMACPKDSASCKAQPPVPGDDGCGAELTDWYKRLTAPPKPAVGPPKPPPPPVTLDRLPTECKAVLETGISRLITPAGTAAGGPSPTTTKQK
jgi:penicillin-insensitive murein DD-endopeptidase